VLSTSTVIGLIDTFSPSSLALISLTRLSQIFVFFLFRFELYLRKYGLNLYTYICKEVHISMGSPISCCFFRL